MSRFRRRGLLLRLLPGLVALTLVAVVGLTFREAVERDIEARVEYASDLRRGQPLDGVPKDPVAALEILEKLLQDHPTNFEILFETARAWADLRSWDKALEHLEMAATVTETVKDKVKAKSQAVDYLTKADRFDDAAAMAAEIVELEPDEPLRTLELGLAHYKGSTAAQTAMVRRFTKVDKDDADVLVEKRIEDFITDLWGDPSAEELAWWLLPDTDQLTHDTLVDDLAGARRRFLAASDTLAGYRHYSRFDPNVAKAYIEVLLRSGRTFEAHLEASLAQRQARVAMGVRRSLWEVQAEIASSMGEHALAAEGLQRIYDSYTELGQWAPSRFTTALLEERLHAEHYQWIVDNVATNRDLNTSTWAEYVLAAAYAALGRTDEALSNILDPFAALSIGSVKPPSVRAYPERRRAILMLGHELFREAGDSRDLTALDALLEQFPDDIEARRLRRDLMLERTPPSLDAAMDDAFALLTRDRRDHDDFQSWLAIADQLSMLRYDKTLARRARSIVNSQRELQVSALRADFERSQIGSLVSEESLDTRASVLPTKDPGLAYEIVRQKTALHELVGARIDLRHLVEVYPDVQEFRFQLARLFVLEGKLDLAAAEFRELLEDAPSDTEALDLALRVERALGRDREAAELLNAMILDDPRGVGAVRYGQRLLEEGYPDLALKLVDRILAWNDYQVGLDVSDLAARCHIALGQLDEAEALLEGLVTQHPESVRVALLGLELGVAQEKSGLVDAALEIMRPLASALFPDIIADIARLLSEAELHDELLSLFEPEARSLPAVRPALRPLAAAAKAVGDFDEAERMLQLLGDGESLRDRFILQALLGRAEDASRTLRLESVVGTSDADLELCFLASEALSGYRALADPRPTKHLRELGLEEEYDEEQLELLDGILRILPALERPEDVLPQSVVQDTLGVYPRAGGDLQRLLEAAGEDADRAAEAARSVLLTLLASDRPLWRREARFLGEHALELVPGLSVTTTMLANRYLDSGDPEAGIGVLSDLLLGARPDPSSLVLFLEASETVGRPEWGLALATAVVESGTLSGLDGGRTALALARTLVERDELREALAFYEAVLTRYPGHREALIGIVRLFAALGRPQEMAERIVEATEAHPDDMGVARVCIDALADVRRLDGEARTIMEGLALAFPSQLRALEALSRAADNEPEETEALLRELLQRMEEQPVSPDSEAWTERVAVARRAAASSRKSGLNDLARQFNALVLRMDPGNIVQYRELAYLELEEGNLALARRYLEVLSYVNNEDKEAALQLGRLLFEQVGQPDKAAQVIDRSFLYSPPPSAVEIQAADLYLRGDPVSALNAFFKVRTSPLVTAETILTVGRIACAANIDESAVSMFDIFLQTAPEDHPARERTQALRELCSPEEVVADA